MARDLERFFRPKSIAIVGATEDSTKINGRTLKYLLDKQYPGKIFPVNPKYESVAGLRCFPDLRAIPEEVDLVIVAVAAEYVPATIEACGDKRVGGAVVYSSGFGETGEEGRRREVALTELARSRNVPMCGPNTLGFWNAFERVVVSFSQASEGEVRPGRVAFVTQSGAFGTAIVALARERGIHFGYFINSGNEADMTFAELLRFVVRDPNIDVIAGYVEGVRDGEELLRVAAEARELGKPIVVVKVGRFAGGARAALSHTGSLAGSDRVYTGIFRQAGIVRAYDVDELVDAVEALSVAPPAKGPKLAIVTQSGGAGVLMADRAEELGLELGALGESTKDVLRKVVPAFGSLGNPIDITAQFVAQPEMLRAVVGAVLADDNVDVAIFYLGMMSRFVDVIVDNLCAAKEASGKPLLVAWIAGPPPAREALRAAGIPMFASATRAVAAARALVEYGKSHSRRSAPHANGRREAAGGSAWPARRAFALLEQADISVAPRALAANAQEAADAAIAFGFPVALKVESSAIVHKTEAGGVRLGLRDATEVRAAFVEVVENARRYAPDATIDGVLVQPMIEGEVELIAGVQSSAWGPLVMVGLGGIFTEVLDDVAFRIAPLADEDAREMLRELRGYRVLEGVRGRPRCDVDAVVATLLALSQLATTSQDIVEIDLNPIVVRAAGKGIVVVDALVIGRPKEFQ